MGICGDEEAKEVITFMPSIRLDRTQPRGVGRAAPGQHGVTQQRPGPRGRASLLGMLHARGTQETIDLRGPDL